MESQRAQKVWKCLCFAAGVLVNIGWICILTVTMALINQATGRLSVANSSPLVDIPALVGLSLAAIIMTNWLSDDALDEVSYAVILMVKSIRRRQEDETTDYKWRNRREMVKLPKKYSVPLAGVIGAGLGALLVLGVCVLARGVFLGRTAYMLMTTSAIMIIVLAVVTLGLVALGLLVWIVSIALLHWYIPYRRRKNQPEM